MATERSTGAAGLDRILRVAVGMWRFTSAMPRRMAKPIEACTTTKLYVVFE